MRKTHTPSLRSQWTRRAVSGSIPGMDTQSPPHFSITIVDRLDDPSLRAGLEHLLTDAVASGASVGFHAPLDPARNAAFWDGVASAIASAGLRLLVARDGAGRVIGAVQMAPSPKQNSPHRADVQKLLVLTDQRGRGVATALMNALYDLARSLGRNLLELDTRAGDFGEPFYSRTGWERAGVLPGHTLEADGSFHDAVMFCRRL